jgi:hypothetical protein
VISIVEANVGQLFNASSWITLIRWLDRTYTVCEVELSDKLLNVVAFLERRDIRTTEISMDIVLERAIPHRRRR